MQMWEACALYVDLVAEYQIFQQKHLKFFQVSTETKGGGKFLRANTQFYKSFILTFLLPLLGF